MSDSGDPVRIQQILAILLIISVLANVYLLFFDSSSPDENRLDSFLENFSETLGNPFNTTLTLNESLFNFTGLEYTVPAENGEPAEFSGELLTEPTPEMTEEPLTEPTSEVTEVPPDFIAENATAEVTAEITPEPTPTPTLSYYVNYTNEKYRFSLEYPRTWELVDKSSSNTPVAVVINTPADTECKSTTTECYKYIGTLSVTIDANPTTLNLEEYFNKAIAHLQEQYSITTTSKSSSTMLSSNKAYRIDYYTRDSRGNRDKSFMQYYAILDKKVYIITYSGPYSTQENVYSRNKGDAQHIIDSFTVDRIYRVV